MSQITSHAKNVLFLQFICVRWAVELTTLKFNATQSASGVSWGRPGAQFAPMTLPDGQYPNACLKDRPNDQNRVGRTHFANYHNNRWFKMLFDVLVTSPCFDSHDFICGEQCQRRHSNLETPLPIFLPSSLDRRSFRIEKALRKKDYIVII